METVITKKPEALKINYTVKPHSQPVYTSEAAARERGVRLSQIVKTMLFKDRNDRMVVSAAATNLLPPEVLHNAKPSLPVQTRV